MMLALCAWIGILVTTPPAPGVAEAEEALAVGEVALATAMYETLAQESHDPALLARAGVLRARLGHFAHAVSYLAEALATKEALGGDAAGVESALAEALAASVPVGLVVHAGPGDWSVSAIRDGVVGLPEIRVTGRVTAPGQQLIVLHLDPGPWRLTVSAAGRPQAERSVSVAKGVEITIDLDPLVDRSARPKDRELVVVSGAVGGAAAIAGVALMAVFGGRASERVGSAGCASDRSTAEICSVEFARYTGRAAFGAGLLGVGLGAVAGGLTGLIGDARGRRRAWIGEAVAGAVVAGAGMAVVGSAHRALKRENTSWQVWETLDRDRLARAAQLDVVGGGLLGAGLGLAVTATAGLVSEKVRRRGGDRRARWELRGNVLRF